ncbi:MAG: hypothetical protein RMZ41_001815 [Nostoc sp. DedVER02]|uniref:hypothetical protein n=1 Tax=unclassified Nostoc TaxID=2593658 RepID=UPI002AD33FE8|nr:MULTISPECIES: hypothetical protein [unclassified Nostoc]MDZ7987104.1 hypothetical protein [Nostoc sp. DedVER02]MDZ8111026.1 hypothetical protein [Nostoc sp. DedVER01b]
MRLSNLLLPVILACSIAPSALADNPCSSIATQEPSQEIRKFDNKKISFDMPANYRIMNTQWGLMVHSPWSYEVYNCQVNSNYPGGYRENGIIVQVMSYPETTKFIQGIYQLDEHTKETFYPETTAKMFVMAGPEAASAIVFFVKNDKVVSIEIPVNSNDDGTGSTEIPEIYKSTVDLIMSTIQVK